MGDLIGEVGRRLRSVRHARGITLDELARTTGISVSTLSRLESGGRKPTLELLLPLSRVYGVPLDDLVGAPAVGDPRVHPRPVRRNGITVIPLTHVPGPQQAVKMVFPTTRNTPHLCRHEGYEWLYVLSGDLRLIVGDYDQVLSPGQAAEFDTRTPHWFGSTGSAPVEVLSLLGLQGQRMHLIGPDGEGMGSR
ncbi:helix-turn-helix domain-containing protein [Devriesea agamarum]|uniref:helix-turn-helix domain-containing protein n=1 Tax=Devriesea agamarum TaxID=472569 RepID=UPI00071CD7FE|nr:helix-turn-helix transcriptional regulator [Devriesea agamarum]